MKIRPVIGVFVSYTLVMMWPSQVCLPVRFCLWTLNWIQSHDQGTLCRWETARNQCQTTPCRFKILTTKYYCPPLLGNNYSTPHWKGGQFKNC